MGRTAQMSESSKLLVLMSRTLRDQTSVSVSSGPGVGCRQLTRAGTDQRPKQLAHRTWKGTQVPGCEGTCMWASTACTLLAVGSIMAVTCSLLTTNIVFTVGFCNVTVPGTHSSSVSCMLIIYLSTVLLAYLTRPNQTHQNEKKSTQPTCKSKSKSNRTLV